MEVHVHMHISISAHVLKVEKKVVCRRSCYLSPFILKMFNICKIYTIHKIYCPLPASVHHDRYSL